jgi:hypothetical protein
MHFRRRRLRLRPGPSVAREGRMVGWRVVGGCAHGAEFDGHVVGWRSSRLCVWARTFGGKMVDNA